MSTAATPQQVQVLEGRVAALEKQVEALLLRLDIDLPEIPWTVICAAVAAVMPDSRITGISWVSESQTETMIQNLWSVGGRLDLFSSHRVR